MNIVLILLKNDKRGLKQRILILLFTIISITILAVSGAGSKLSCDIHGNCTLIQKTLFDINFEKFRWTALVHVQTGLSEKKWGSSAGKGAATENLYLRLAVAGINSQMDLPIFLKGVAWPIGNLNYQSLEAAREATKPPSLLWAVSLGGASWFISFIFGSVAVLFFLFLIIEPLNLAVSADRLKIIRKMNLIKLALVTFSALILWSGILFSLIYHFSDGSIFS